MTRDRSFSGGASTLRRGSWAPRPSAPRAPTPARPPDRLALPDASPAADANRAQVGVDRLPSVAVVEHNQVAVAAVRPAGEDHHPGVRRPRGRACPGGDVDPEMPRPIIITGKVVIGGRPDEPDRKSVV